MVGLSIRTTNAEEADPSTARIPALWNRFGREEWPRRLEMLDTEGPILAVYSGYESDMSGSYRLLLGRGLIGAPPVPRPLELIETSGGDYLAFPCPGPLPQAVIKGWRDVWAFFARPESPARAYTADFEIYGTDPGTLQIWIAVRGAGGHAAA